MPKPRIRRIFAREPEAFTAPAVVAQAPIAMATGFTACIFIHRGRAQKYALIRRVEVRRIILHLTAVAAANTWICRPQGRASWMLALASSAGAALRNRLSAPVEDMLKTR